MKLKEKTAREILIIDHALRALKSFTPIVKKFAEAREVSDLLTSINTEDMYVGANSVM